MTATLRQIVPTDVADRGGLPWDARASASDQTGEAKRLHGTLRDLDRMGRPEIADEKERSPLAGEAKPLERANKNLQGINADMKAVFRDAGLTSAEKRQRLDSLVVERNRLMKDAVLDAKAAQLDKQ